MIVQVKPDKIFIKACDNIMKNVPQMQERATRDALRTGRAAFMDSTGGAPSVYNVKKSKDLAPNTKVTKDSIVVESRLFTIGTTTHFSITPSNYKSQEGKTVKRRQRATATIKRGSKRALPQSFIANPAKIPGGNVMLWERFLPKSNKIRPVKSISAAQMASNEKVYPYIEEKLTEAYQKRLQHHYEREVARNAGH